MKTKEHSVRARVWTTSGKSVWYFITVPTVVTEELGYEYGLNKRSWGSVPVSVTLGDTSWNTSIFRDAKERSYVLPLNARVRKAEKIKEGNMVQITLRLRIP